MGGPWCNHLRMDWIASLSPQTSTSTLPSGLFVACPVSPSRDATFLALARKKTPCTLPRTTNRTQAVEESVITEPASLPETARSPADLLGWFRGAQCVQGFFLRLYRIASSL